MRDRFKSFRHAWNGVVYTFRGEKNFQIQILIGGLVFVLMDLLHLPFFEKVILVLLVMLVLILELVNTAVEKMMDMLEPETHPTVGIIKDVMAGAVLLAAVGAGFLGLVLFWAPLEVFLKTFL
jgi:diacylglycerol kinase